MPPPSNTITPQEDPRALPPWPLIVLGLVSMGALAVKVTRPVDLLQLAVLMPGLALPKLVRFRFAADSWNIWMARVLLYPVLIGLHGIFTMSEVPGHGLYNAAVVHAIGYLIAAEMVLQQWKARPSGGRRGGALILLSGLIILTACNTVEHLYLRWYVPLYAGTLIAAVYYLRERQPLPTNYYRLGAAWVGLAACSSILAGGALFYWALFSSKETLNNTAMEMAQWFMKDPQVGVPNHIGLRPLKSGSRALRRILEVRGNAGLYHLRGKGYVEYGDVGWINVPEQERARADDQARYSIKPVSALAPNPAAVEREATITRWVDDLPYLVAPAHAVGLELTRVQEFLTDPNDPVRQMVRAPAPYSYFVFTASTPAYQGPLCPPPEAEYLAKCLVYDHRWGEDVKALAGEICAKRNATTPLEKVRAIEAYLLDAYRYELNAPTPARGHRHADPVAFFLLDSKRGHCEFFASGAVALLRAQGIPARVAWGFVVHEPAGQERWIVRDQDSHAWAEAWVEGHGWITVEATPGDGRPEQTGDEPGFFRWAQEWVYDSALAVGDWVLEQDWLTLGLLAFGLVAPAIIYFWLREYWSRRATAAVPDGMRPRDEALAALAVQFESLLASMALPCPLARTWREHLNSALEPDDPRLPVALAFVQAYEHARFGQEALAPRAHEHLSALRALVNQSRQVSTTIGATRT
jgi:transglutaminase-like putative cysteine protease